MLQSIIFEKTACACRRCCECPPPALLSRLLARWRLDLKWWVWCTDVGLRSTCVNADYWFEWFPFIRRKFLCVFIGIIYVTVICDCYVCTHASRWRTQEVRVRCTGALSATHTGKIGLRTLATKDGKQYTEIGYDFEQQVACVTSAYVFSWVYKLVELRTGVWIALRDAQLSMLHPPHLFWLQAMYADHSKCCGAPNTIVQRAPLVLHTVSSTWATWYELLSRAQHMKLSTMALPCLSHLLMLEIIH